MLQVEREEKTMFVKAVNPSDRPLPSRWNTTDEKKKEEMEMTFSLCYHRPLFFLLLHSF
jgi:hypothetical protein